MFGRQAWKQEGQTTSSRERTLQAMVVEAGCP